MTVWCHLPTIFNQRQALRIAGLLLLSVALTTTLLFANVTQAVQSTTKTINFQGRLSYGTGGVVADGFYNMQFKIYEGGTGSGGGSLQWTETYINNGGNNAVEIKNGYFSVNLGSVNQFGTSVDWEQDTLFLSMNVAGSATNCTAFNAGSCVADGEMTPMKRITATPYAINAGAVGGKTVDNLVQLAQGVQNEAGTNTDSIFINKTQASGNALRLQNAGTDVFKVDYGGDIEFGNQANHYIGVAQANENTVGNNITMSAGMGGNGTGSRGGNLLLQGGAAGGTNANGGDIYLDAGAGSGTGLDGEIDIGAARARSIVIGSVNSAITQEILIGANNAGGTANVTIGSGGSAAAGSTKIQSKDDTTISTNGVDRAVFDNTGKLFVGNGKASGAPIGFTIQGTNSSTTGVTGGSLTVQGGNATTGNANGGNLTLSGGTGTGTGTNGLVILTTPTFSTTTNDANCYAGGALVASSCTIATSSINNSSAIIVGFSATSQTATMPDPTNVTAGRVIYITAANNSSDFTLSLNGGGTGNLTAMRQNTTATLIWNGSDWTVAGASNSTTLQSAYDNTLQSAGGAEIVVSNGTNANGLTIRDSATNPVNGTLLEVQNASASTLFSVNSNVPEYATNGGAETAGSPFPANTWSAYGGSSTVTRHTNTTDGYVATGQASAKVAVTGFLSGIKNQLSTTLKPNMKYNVSFGARLESGTVEDLSIAYATDGSSASATCTWSDAALIKSAWKKVSCSFTTPSGTLSSSNAIIIAQVSGGSRTYYVDNLSVTIAGNQNYAADGTVNDGGSFATNWSTTGTGSSITRITNDGQEKSDSAEVTTSTGGSNRGIRNLLAKKPLPDTLYRLSVYAKSSNSFSDFSIRYTLDGSSFSECSDYSNSLYDSPQTVSTTEWTEITCYIKTPLSDTGTPAVHLVQAGSAARVFKVDTFEMTLATNTAANVQIGGGAKGGQTTLFTLDQGGSAPIAENNEALLGSMYYDTTLGKIQCYESDGWGACGSSPDNIVTISPEYTNAVMHGTGVGTMTSDLCSDALNINDGSGSPTQPTICGTNETYNFYKWTSPQSSPQAYGIYVTYQLPTTFKEFASGSTSLMGRTDSSNASVTYQVYRSNSSGLSPCGSAITVSNTTQTTWQTVKATGTADPSTCGFVGGDSVVFKILTSAQSNANAYVGNLGFTYSNR